MILNKIIKLVIVLVFVGALVTPPVAAAWPAEYYSPFVDVGLFPNLDLSDFSDATGTKYYQLGFVTENITTRGGEPAWAGYYPVEENYFKSNIDALRAQGGDISISFGGQTGVEIACNASNVTTLTAHYQSFIDAYGADHIDFDLEGATLRNWTANALRDQAIVRLQTANPDLKVSYTIPIVPQGLDAWTKGLIKNTSESGARIDTINIMAFDYGSGPAPDPDGRMGYYAEVAATSLYDNLSVYYPEKSDSQRWAMIGITPMTGYSDLVEITTVANAQEILSFAENNSIGWIGLWSANRDKEGNTSLSQDPYAFSNTFASFGVTPSPSPTATPTATPTPSPAPAPEGSWPATVYAPYVDVSLYPPHFVHLMDMKDACGVKYSTLCFINADEETGNIPAWGGQGHMIPLSEQSIREEIKAIRAAGGDVIVSFGGADAGGHSYTLAQKWTDVAELQAQYQKVITMGNITWIDFDVEEAALHNESSIDRRNQAIAGLKAANPGLKVAYCLPCQPETGFGGHAIKIVDSAIANGAEIDYWNAMAMDYGTWFTVDLGLGTNMSKLGILTAEKINGQLQTKFGYTEAEAYAHMGYTPMIGQTDMNDAEHDYAANEVFWLNTSTQDATVIKNFVISKNIPLMGAWSANRDANWSVRNLKADARYSGIPQDPYDFSKIFVQIEAV